jgi:chemotaxis-related protein WspB
MQFLLFHIGKDRYGLHTQRIVRVVPLVQLKAVPQAPEWVAGLMNFHGAAVPVVDLTRLACGTPARHWFSTRIVLVNHPAGLLGLAAERMGGIATIDAAALQPPGVAAPGYLGQVSAQDGGMIQLVEIDHLLPEQVRTLLYPQAEAAC